jgi:hypothetical protein
LVVGEHFEVLELFNELFFVDIRCVIDIEKEVKRGSDVFLFFELQGVVDPPLLWLLRQVCFLAMSKQVLSEWTLNAVIAFYRLRFEALLQQILKVVSLVLLWDIDIEIKVRFKSMNLKVIGLLLLTHLAFDRGLVEWRERILYVFCAACWCGYQCWWRLGWMILYEHTIC